jgi:hypothetical protein
MATKKTESIFRMLKIGIAATALHCSGLCPFALDYSSECALWDRPLTLEKGKRRRLPECRSAERRARG